MLKKFAPIPAFLLFMAALAAPAFGVVSGDPAPDWTLNAYGGGSHTLSDYRGKVVAMFVVGYG